ncbi:MAG: peptidoglycan editing factor PgeF [Amphiplicatus sp.]
MTPPHLKSALLDIPGIRHGFFGRAGGVSSGDYASLNTGPGSDDDDQAVAENRARCAQALDVEPARLLTLYQVHSPNAVIVAEPWRGPGAKADAMATRLPGVALGVLAADCMPFLFYEPEAQVIAAAHAGWRGALAGVLDATVAAMTGLGAKPHRVLAALGPCLRQPNFEVGMDLVAAFTEKHPGAARFFAAGTAPEKRQFDLAGFGRWRLQEAGVPALDDLGVCTLAARDAYFSYRASRRAGAPDYGRNLSAIALAGERA